MPELPEVQTVVDTLCHAGIIGRHIVGVEVNWSKTISDQTPESFTRCIKGLAITSIRRRGKYIIFDFDASLSLLIHLRMTGRLLVTSNAEPISKHVQVVLHLSDNRCLHFHDTRKFGRMQLTKRAAAVLDRLGPEPLSPKFTARQFQKALLSRKRCLKPLLLDQTFIAGLGNIYVDEALWASKIHPLRISSTLADHEIKMLHRAIRKVLRKGLQNNGTSLGGSKTNFISADHKQGRNQLQLNVFRRTNRPCPRCRNKIKRIIVGQRSSHICEACQSPPHSSTDLVDDPSANVTR
jgi:formamidopyrimidine-DNA glycosylase